MTSRRNLAWTVVEVVCIGALGFASPYIISDRYIQGILVNALLFSMIALGLQLIMGYAGQISLGQAAFMGVGAYTSVLLTKAGVSFWLALPVAGIAAGLAGFIMSPIIKLRGVYFAMASLAFNIAIYVVFVNWDAVTNATKGIIDIPSPKLGPFIIDKAADYMTLTIFALWIQWRCFKNIVNSGFGRVLRAIRDNETATSAAGINIIAYKMKVIAVGCFVAGIAGAIMSHYKGIVSPEPFNIWDSITFALMLVIGGLGSLRGAVVGAFFMSFASEYIGAYAAQHRMLIYGIMMLLFMLFLPEGLDGVIKTGTGFFKRAGVKPKEMRTTSA
jgi:branched-chain amino acid transport system permease protein